MKNFVLGYTYESVCVVFPMIYTFGADYIIAHGWHKKEVVDAAIKKIFERIKITTWRIDQDETYI